MMKAYLVVPLLLSVAAILHFDFVESQSIMSPFVVLCRQTCGGYGLFRRLCCMVDSVCCSKPETCPEDTTADTLIPFCQSCTEDVDCMFRSKCCESDGRKCCTAIRTSMFRNSFYQRAKEKKDSIGTASKIVTNSTEKAEEKEEEENEDEI